MYSLGGEFAAVVSLAAPPMHSLPRPEALRLLVRHQQILEHVLRDAPLLPVTLGTCLPNELQMGALLAQGEPLFRTAFGQLQGRTQVEIVARWDLEAVLAQVAAEPDLANQKAAIAALPPAEVPAALAHAGRLVKQALDRRRAALRNQLLHALFDIGDDRVVNDSGDDTLIVSVALLVNEGERVLLDDRLDELDALLAVECPNMVQLQVIGPLPPYSFANVSVEQPDPHAIEAARRLLELPAQCATGEIRRAYRRRASTCHPDVNAGYDGAQTQLAALAEAQRLLLRYAHGRGPVCDFSLGAVAETLLIAVRRQDAPEHANSYAS